MCKNFKTPFEFLFFFFLIFSFYKNSANITSQFEVVILIQTILTFGNLITFILIFCGHGWPNTWLYQLVVAKLITYLKEPILVCFWNMVESGYFDTWTKDVVPFSSSYVQFKVSKSLIHFVHFLATTVIISNRAWFNKELPFVQSPSSILSWLIAKSTSVQDHRYFPWYIIFYVLQMPMPWSQ